MGKNLIMKKILILLIVLAGISFGQAGYVEYDHNIYNFLQRMQITGIITNYDEFEIPKATPQVIEFLREIELKRDIISDIDRQRLNDFLREFQFENKTDIDNYHSLFPEFSLAKHFDEKEKALFISADSNNFFLKVNFRATIENHFNHNLLSRDAAMIFYGGSISGRIQNNIGFYIYSTNGTFVGNRSLVSEQPRIKYNYKFNESPGQSANSDYFDETEGFLSYNTKHIDLKIGRDRKLLGYGKIKNVLSEIAPPMDYLSFSIKYGIFSFDYTHGKLLGNLTISSDSVIGSIKSVGEKYFVHHRFRFDLSKIFSLGFGENLIYSRRSMDLAYLNPLNYFKSIEHFNQDRDNSQIFLDFTYKPVDGFLIFLAFHLDDINFSEIGKGWHGNQTAYNLLLSSTLIEPFDLSFQFLLIEPYFYTHRIQENNFTNLNHPLVGNLQPNSLNFYFFAEAWLSYKLMLGFSAGYSIHGTNVYDPSGKLLINNGGSVIDSRRNTLDALQVFFLDGPLEIKKEISFQYKYEIISGIFMIGDIVYLNKIMDQEKSTSVNVMNRLLITL